MSELNISICWHGKHLLLRFHLKKLLQNRNKLTHRNRGSIPQIKNPKLRRPFLLPATPSTLLGRIQSPQTPLHNIVNVGEIPRHGPTIGGLKYRNLLSLENILREEEIRHVGSAPRPVNREEPKTSDGKPIYVVIAVSDFLASLLRRRVETSRLVCTVLLGERNLRIEPVDGAGRGPNHRRLRVRVFAGL